jgi:hypothetical protein
MWVKEEEECVVKRGDTNAPRQRRVSQSRHTIYTHTDDMYISTGGRALLLLLLLFLPALTS